jgi:hypothetical protein
MTDELTAEGSTPVAICPWCSAPLSASDTATCSTCGAKLLGEGDEPLPGLTAIDPLAVIEGAREPRRPRNRFVAWLTGSDIEDAAQQPASAEALAPPPPEVRREILRLQMEAELSQLSAEVEAIASDEALAAEDKGDATRAQAAVAAVLGADAATDRANDAAEEAATRVETGAETERAAAEAGSTAVEADAAAAEVPSAALDPSGGVPPDAR